MVANVSKTGLLQGRPNGLFGAHYGPRWPCHRSLDLLSIGPCPVTNVVASRHPTSKKPLKMQSMGQFGPFGGTLERDDPVRSDEVRARAPFVAIPSRVGAIHGVRTNICHESGRFRCGSACWKGEHLLWRSNSAQLLSAAPCAQPACLRLGRRGARSCSGQRLAWHEHLRRARRRICRQ